MLNKTTIRAISLSFLGDHCKEQYDETTKFRLRIMSICPEASLDKCICILTL